MDITSPRLIGTGLALLIVFVAGFGLINAEKPYNFIVFNLHKLVAVGVLIFFAVTAYQMNQTMRLTSGELTACIVTVIVFVATIITGGLVSLETQMPPVVLLLHRIMPFVTLVCTVGTLIFIVRGR